MKIEIDDLSRPQVHALLDEHLQNMFALSPPESVHALDISHLRKPDIVFLTAWDDDQLLGCGALKELDPGHGEVKSMRTAMQWRRRGVGRAILERILLMAGERAYQRLSLETGSMPAFIPAQRLYQSMGFTFCPPFSGYAEDPNSVFMTKQLQVQGVQR